MSRAAEESNRRMLRARDAMDRGYARPLDVASLARTAHTSEAHFIRTFSRTFREIVGQSPTEFRDSGEAVAVPTCFAMAWSRPGSNFGEARRAGAA